MPATCLGKGTVQGFPLFYDFPPSRGASDPSPGGQRTTLPDRRVGHGTRNAPGTEKGCCEGGTWCHSETAGGRAELEARSFFLSVLAPVMRRGQRRAAVWVDVAPQRDRGRPSGTRGSQLLLGVL